MEVSEKKATTVRAGASRAYRELEGPRLLVYYILDLLRFHSIFLQSEHWASELGAELHQETRRLQLPIRPRGPHPHRSRPFL